ncbi:sulfatase-like hydrolase/transferase [Flavihumibacter rivuli]|uniref:sulfatase-like hydrolase/transferase n=1 Tax=Flavihumibacter rivuli TaxID=2838156 RepID=UPI001BDDE956|nr:sulfatase-like hydrolase/transferase [Flavihumibacter rivuli]ULQ58098.1 sulfatase-like hydrolase/transferase [Flavihumibacter rivuli]
MDRTSLPIREPARPFYTELDVRNATPPTRFEVKAPQGAPNVVIVLIDDMGFGVSEAFGGPIPMPTLNRLANNGLRYNRFHTTALCAPTRVALLTGYNHHSNNMGAITELATTYPGNTAVRPQTITPMAEVLRQNGYNTAQFGKCHEVPPWEISNSGPQDRWPTRSGFEKFYGFLGGETNQWSPLIYDGVTMVETPEDPNYHFTTDMTNQAISWVRLQQALTPGNPFFMYYAPGATHAPHHAPKAFIDKYKGKFDKGWDVLRKETFERQKQMGIIPRNTQLAPKPADIKDWDKLSPDEQKLFARQMEVYAGFADHTDYEIGRLVKTLEDLGVMDNTVFIFIAGDNGASAEGQMNGMFSEMSYFNEVPETVPDMLKKADEWGSPSTYPHYSAGWAVAMDVPFTWTKQMASDFGGTRNGMVVCWPKGIKAKGEVRSQFAHVVDIAPTIYEISKIPAPKTVNGIPQDPIEGTSIAYSFNAPASPEKHKVQYFEMFGNRGIYSDGWYARTIHKAPWSSKPYNDLSKDVWELYNTKEDFSLANNLAAKEPARLKSLQDLFMKEAVKYHVLPLDDRTFERMIASQMGRPNIMEGRTSVTYGEGMKGMGVDVFVDLRSTSYTIKADVEVDNNGNGVIVCQGGRFGGLSFYLKGGKPAFTYNFLGMSGNQIMASEPLKPGKHNLVFDFNYDGGGQGKGGAGIIMVDGVKVAEGRIDKTQPGIFSVDDLADVGLDEGTPVADYGPSSKFSGKIDKVYIEVRK